MGIGIASDDVFIAVPNAFYVWLEANLMILLKQLAETEHIDRQYADLSMTREVESVKEQWGWRNGQWVFGVFICYVN